MNWRRILFDVDLATGVSRRNLYLRRRRNWPGPLFWTRAAWRRNLALLTSQLNAIVRCNAPLVTGLERAIADGPSLKLTQAMIALSDDLSSGMRLADAMEQCPRFYPKWYVDLIRAGESTGTLEHSLSAAGEHLATSQQFTKSVSGWFAYIGAVLAIQLSIATFLFTYIVPAFGEVLREFGARLPAVIIAIDRLTNSVTRGHVYIVILACAGLLVLKWVRRVSGEERIRFHRVFAPLLAPLPIVGEISAKGHLAAVCAVLERLAAANVPINDALRDCAELDIPDGLRRALLRARARVEQGYTLSDALRAERAFPRSFVTMLALGEASGKLDSAAGHLHTLYRQQVMSNIRMTLDIAGPIGVLGLGAVALALYGGIFASLIAISDTLINVI
ncbi:MAG: type II secretion system F family protein [Candidatus Hydrogenedentes bacterium]|nr:type II secretion system F family protein [Candidatus Hydrogenedentota bacterium]